MASTTIDPDRALAELRRALGERLRRFVAGDAEPRPMPADGGLFGPDSVTWDVHGDASMFVGGLRSLLIQTLHPPTMAGVADHSEYTSDPLGRFQRTTEYLAVTTYGTVAEAEQVIAMVRSIHDHVEGTTPDGEPYRANDPHLLAWVHATEVESFLTAKQQFGRNRLDADQADRYVAEMSEIGRRIGVIDPPETVADLTEVVRSYRPELGLNHQSRAGLRFLAFPPLAPMARAPYGVIFAGAVSTLPLWARRRLRLPWFPVAEQLAVRPAAAALVKVFDWGMTGLDQRSGQAPPTEG